MRNHSYENVFDLYEDETACRTHFHKNGFTLKLVLKQRHKRTWKWPIELFLLIHQDCPRRRSGQRWLLVGRSKHWTGHSGLGTKGFPFTLDFIRKEWVVNHLRADLTQCWFRSDQEYCYPPLPLDAMVVFPGFCHVNSLRLARKYARIFVRGHYLSREANSFRERSSRKTVSFEEQIMSNNKYLSIFWPQIETIVLIILQIFYATHAVLKIGGYSRISPSFSWGIFGHVTCLDQSRASERFDGIGNIPQF